MSKTQKRWPWFLVGLAGILIAAPNATIIRHTTVGADPTLFNILRFGFLSLALTPYIFLKRRSLRGNALKHSLLVGVFMSIAVTSYVWAISLSQASYVTIITLLSPIIFICYSVRLNKEKISHRSIAGISLAAAGAFTIVALPILLKQGSVSQIYPFATVLSLINTLSFPLAIIFSKRAHDAGAPLLATLGVSAWVIFLSSVITVPLSLGGEEITINHRILFGALYSAVMVALISRLLGILVYERLGAVTSSLLAYLETLIAVILPVLLIKEILSKEMVVGGIFILIGVYVVERHKVPDRKHIHNHRH